MKRIKILIAIGVFTMAGKAQSLPTGYEIATWYGFSKAAVSYTFDDNTPKQFTVALPLFEQFGYRTTLYPVTNWVSDWEQLKKASAMGHEIGCHSQSHPNLGSIDTAAQERELSGSKATIESQIGSGKCTTIAYPYCITGQMDITQRHFVAGRICSGQINAPTHAEDYLISSISLGDQGLNTPEALNQKCDEAATMNGWCVFLLHGIDDDGGYSPITSPTLTSHLTRIREQGHFWVAPFGQVFQYLKQRQNAIITETSSNKQRIELTLTDGLDNTLFNQPLTITKAIPNNWKKASVTQNGQNVTYKTHVNNGQRYVVFDAVPDAGGIVIKK